MASIAERRCVGVYSSSREIRSMASAEALRNTYSNSLDHHVQYIVTGHIEPRTFEKGCGLICGNLCSM